MRKRLKFRAFPHKASFFVYPYLLALFCCPMLSSYATASDADGNGKPEVNLTVGRKMICAEHGKTVCINCYLTIHHRNVSLDNAWSLLWQDAGYLGRQSKLQTANETRTVRNSSMLTMTSSLSVYANWSGVERVFTCVAEYRSSKAEVYSPQMNESVLVRIKPWPITNISLRLLEMAGRKMIIEVFWKPLELSPVVYTLKYCITPSADMPDVRPACPHYGSAKSECRFREMNSYYKVPHPSGIMCKATLNLGYNLLMKQVYRVYVASQRTGCETNGKKHGFCVNIYNDLFSKCPNKLKTFYMIPQPVIHVNVSTIDGRNVRVFWSNLPRIFKDYRNYIVLYNCSTNVTVSQKNTTTTSISLYGGHDFHPYRPYALCEFCVRARIEKRVLSKPVCTRARLREEVPSGSPRFLCFGNDCVTKSDWVERNVTVTWDLPQVEEWNGVLENVTLIYNNRTQIEVSDTNLTRGATVLQRLAINRSYDIKIVACNKEGCSSPGNYMAIPPLPLLHVAPKQQAVGEDGIAGKVAMAIGFPIAFILIVCVSIVLWRWMKLRRSIRKDCLPPVVEPIDYDSAEVLPRTEDVIYYNIDRSDVEL